MKYLPSGFKGSYKQRVALFIASLGLFVLIVLPCFQTGLTQEISKEDLENLKKLSPEQLKSLKSGAMNKENAEVSSVDSSMIKAFLNAKQGNFSILPSDTANLITEETDSLRNLPDSLESELTVDGLSYFGYDVFNLVPGSFQPSDIGPVPPDYYIGPGDEIILTIWGDNESHESLTVSREGFLLLPDAGRVLVNGLTLEKLEDKITTQLSKVYSGIRKKKGKSSTFVDVSLGKLRSIKVFILGEVRRPGGYSLRAVSNVFNALYYAGGPTVDGTMRNVELRRGNRKIASIDLYNYLLSGGNADDIRLENGDAIYVSAVGPRVRIDGEIKRPAIYEIRANEEFSDLIQHTGGLKSTAYIKRAQIRRVVPFEQRDVFGADDWITVDVDLEEILNGTELCTLHDNDEITIFEVGDEFKNFVSISGEVVRKPGRYQFIPGMKLRDLIKDADSLKGDVYWNYGHLIRQNEDKSQDILSFNLREVIQSPNGENLLMQPRDSVIVYSIWDFEKRYNVSILGAVRNPGEYSLYGGMGLRDLIIMAGGLQNYAYTDTIEVSRIQNEDGYSGTTVIKIPTSPEYIEGIEDEKILLHKFDKVYVREQPDWEYQKIVSIEGEVKYPGYYVLYKNNENLISLINRAGGLESTAYPQAAMFTRAQNNTGRLAINLEDVLENPDSKYNLKLVEGDRLYIPEKPQTVKVVGETYYPSAILYVKGKSFKYYIDQAGGFNDNADKSKVTVVMANGLVKKPSLLSNVKPDAGSTIIIPSKIEKPNGNTLKDVASIVGILSSAVTTIYLINQTTK